MAVETLVLAVDHQTNALVARNHRLEREPPQFAEPVREACRNVERERNLVFLQDRVGELQIVAIAVVESETDEAPARIALREAAMHLIERHDIEARAAQLATDLLE